MIHRFAIHILFIFALMFCLSCELPPKEKRPDPEPDHLAFIMADPRQPDIMPEWLAICPAKHVKALTPILRTHHSRKMKIRVVTSESIYQHFGKNKVSSDAIRNFINFMSRKDKHRQLRYLLLVGTADPDNRAGLYLPTILSDKSSLTAQLNGQFAQHVPVNLAGDLLYGINSQTQLPEIAVGRFPARTHEQLREMASKASAYEQHLYTGVWRRRIEYVYGPDHFKWTSTFSLNKAHALVHAKQIPAGFNMHTTFARQDLRFSYPILDFKQHMVKRMNQGPAFMMYTGKGVQNAWGPAVYKQAFLNLIDSKLKTAIFIPGYRTNFFALAPWTARLDGSSTSFGEDLIQSHEGPVIYFGASRSTHPYIDWLISVQLNHVLFEPKHKKVGDLIVAMQHALLNQQQVVKNTIKKPEQLTDEQIVTLTKEHLACYSLLGDPAATITVPRAFSTLEAPATARQGQSITIKYNSKTRPYGRVHYRLALQRIDNLKMPFKPFKPYTRDYEFLQTRAYMLANNLIITEGGGQLDNKTNHWLLHIPKNCPTGQLMIHAYAETSIGDTIASTQIQILPASSSTQPATQP